MLTLLQKIYAHVQAGEYEAAAKAVWELAGGLMGWMPMPMLAAGDDDIEACLAECEKIKAADAAPVGADETQNPAVWIMLIQVLVPVLVEWLKNRKA